MLTRRGEGSNRSQVKRIVSRAICPVIDQLEDRRMLAANPVVVFDFNTDPTAGVTNTGSGGAAYNGTLAGPTLPTFQNSSPSPAGGGYLNFQGDGLSIGSGGRIDLSTQLQGILGKSATIAFWSRTTQVAPMSNADGPQDAVWQSPSVTGVEQAGGGNDLFLGDIDHTGRMRGQYGDGAGTITQQPVNDNAWHHIAISRDSATGVISLYEDGKLQQTVTGDTGDKTSPFNSIGALTQVDNAMQNILGYNYYNGDLDQVEIYDSALSPTDIAAKYNKATTAPTTPVLTNKTSGPGDARFNIGNVDGETALNVLRADSAAGPFTQIAQLPADTANFTDKNIVPGKTYYYKVAAFNGVGTTESAVLTAAVPTSGTGLTAYYYNTGFWGSNNRPTDYSSMTAVGRPTQVSAVATVDYNWGTGAPNPPFSGNLKTDNFSTAFVGTLLIPKDFDGNPAVDSTYQVTLISNTDDDGAIFVDNLAVSTDPNGHGPRDSDDAANTAGTHPFAITVTEGVPVDIVMLQAEQGGGAAAQLKWQVTASDFVTQIIPKSIIPEDFLHTAEIPIAAAPTLGSITKVDPYTVQVNYSDASTSELRFELLRSEGTTFNAATASLVGYGPMNGFQVFDRQAVPGKTYTYVVRAANSAGFKDSNPMTFTQDAITGGGAVAHYFNNNNWGTGVTTPPMEGGAPDLSEVVPHVDYDFGNNPPNPAVVADNFSVVYQGKITIPDNGNGTPNENIPVKFVGNSDDDGYLYVNGVLVSADGGGHGQRDADTRPVDATHFVNPITLTEGQSYTFMFFMRDTGGGAGAHIKWDNPATGVREAVPDSAYTSAFTGPAAAPTNLAAPAPTLGAHQAQITWTDNATNEARYEIERAVVTNGVVGDYVSLAVLPINSTSFTDSGLTNSTTYSYRIRAFGYDGASSTDLQVTTLAMDIPPLAPSNLVVLPRAGGNYMVFTDNSVNESNFVIERADVTGGVVGAFAPLATVAGTAPGTTGARIKYTDASAVVGSTYVYRVHATNLGGDSANVTSGNVTTAAQGGVGLQATWFDNIDFTGPSVTKDVPLFQDFGNGSPDAAIGPDQFSGVLIGSVKAEFSEKYTFYTDSDDGVDLTLIDAATGTVLIDHGGAGIYTRRGLTGGGATGGFADVAGMADLVAGHSYILQVRQVEDGGGAGYKVGWSSPSLPQEVIPTDLAFAPTNTETLFAPLGANGGASVADNAVSIAFTDINIDDTGYVLERSTSPDGTYTQVGSIAGNVGVGRQVIVDNGSVSPLAANTTYYYRIHAVRGATAGANSAPLTVKTSTGLKDLVINGSAKVLPGADGDINATADNVLQLTDNANDMNSSVWLKNPQPIVQAGKGTGGAAGFSTSFNLVVPDGQHTDPPADGMTFTIQGRSNTAMGGGGGSVGYANGIENSVAVHFRYYQGGTPATAVSQVGVWQNGIIDNSNEMDTGVGNGFALWSGHNYKVDISYDDGVKGITVTITDLTDNTVFPFSAFFAVDVPAVTGDTAGFVGLTGATGGANVEQDITNWSFNGTAIPFVAPPTAAAPKVTNVYLSGTTWSAAFKNYIGANALGDATFGYEVAGGANQLKDLPWTNLDQISIKFDSDVAVTQNSLVIHGVNTPVIATTGFSYDATKHVATWTLGSSLTKDKINLGLASAGVTLASDPTLTLDGEYTTSTTTGPSGDGTAGGDFNFRVNVLPGDVDQTSPVIASDVSLVINRQLKSTASTGYGIFYDVDGSGLILANDVSQVKNRQLSVLPAGEPVAGSPVAGDAVTASVAAAPVTSSSTTTSTAKVKAKPVVKAAKPVVVLPAKVPAFAVKRIKRNDLFN